MSNFLQLHTKDLPGELTCMIETLNQSETGTVVAWSNRFLRVFGQGELPVLLLGSTSRTIYP